MKIKVLDRVYRVLLDEVWLKFEYNILFLDESIIFEFLDKNSNFLHSVHSCGSTHDQSSTNKLAFVKHDHVSNFIPMRYSISLVIIWIFEQIVMLFFPKLLQAVRNSYAYILEKSKNDCLKHWAEITNLMKYIKNIIINFVILKSKLLVFPHLTKRIVSLRF